MSANSTEKWLPRHEKQDPTVGVDGERPSPPQRVCWVNASNMPNPQQPPRHPIDPVAYRQQSVPHRRVEKSATAPNQRACASAMKGAIADLDRQRRLRLPTCMKRLTMKMVVLGLSTLVRNPVRSAPRLEGQADRCSLHRQPVWPWHLDAEEDEIGGPCQQ